MIQSDIRVKSYCRLNLLSDSLFNFKRLDIFKDVIGHSSQKLLSFDLSRYSLFNFGHVRIFRVNRTSESKVMAA